MKYNFENGFNDELSDLNLGSAFATQIDPLDILLSDIFGEELFDIPDDIAKNMFQLIDLEVSYNDDFSINELVIKIRTLYGTTLRMRKILMPTIKNTKDTLHLMAICCVFMSNCSCGKNCKCNNNSGEMPHKILRRQKNMSDTNIPVEEIGQLLNLVSEKVPTLFNNIMTALYSGEAGKNMGRAVGNFYKELIEAGIPETAAKEMTREYLLTLKSVTDCFKNINNG